jgi:hypothetical protein
MISQKIGHSSNTRFILSRSPNNLKSCSGALNIQHGGQSEFEAGKDGEFSMSLLSTDNR